MKRIDLAVVVLAVALAVAGTVSAAVVSTTRTVDLLNASSTTQADVITAWGSNPVNTGTDLLRNHQLVSSPTLTGSISWGGMVGNICDGLIVSDLPTHDPDTAGTVDTMAAFDSGSQVVFRLDGSYDISQIDSFTAYNQRRSGQKYTVEVSSNGGTDWSPLASVDYANGDGYNWEMRGVSLKDSAGISTAIATNVNALRFTVSDPTGGDGKAIYGEIAIYPVMPVLTFSPDGGVYGEPTSVTITCSIPGATICYTTDETTPSNSPANGTEISSGASVPISTTTTLKARAWMPDGRTSEVKVATYYFTKNTLIGTDFGTAGIYTYDTTTPLPATGVQVGGDLFNACAVAWSPLDGSFYAGLWSGMIYRLNSSLTNYSEYYDASVHIVGMACDAAGNLYYTDDTYNVVKMYDGMTETTVIDASADLDVPRGLAFDSAGRLYVSNYNLGMIRRYTYSGGSWVYDRSYSDPSNLHFGEQIAFDVQDNLYAASRFNGKVVKFDIVTGASTAFPTLGGQPVGITVDPCTGYIYVNDLARNNTVVYGSDGTVKGQIDFPSNWTSAQGQSLSISNNDAQRLTFSPDGGVYGEPTSVTITCSIPGATIRYTTDETTPSNSPANGTEISSGASVPISTTTTLKARAWAPDGSPSMVKCATYTFLTNRPVNIPAGTATVDGDLSDWTTGEFVPLDQPYYGIPDNAEVSNASYAVRWGLDKVYVAIKVRDMHPVFTDGYDNWNTRDAVELYLHTTGTGPQVYTLTQADAQEYAVGFNYTDNTTVWSCLRDIAVPEWADFSAAGRIDGQWLCYEAAMTPFKHFDLNVESNCEVSELHAGDVIGLDVVVGSLGGNNGFAMLAENLNTNKAGDYTQIVPHLLTAAPVPGDVNGDRVVNADDLAIVLAVLDSKPPTDVRADLDGDGEVTSGDLAIVLANMP